MKKALFTLLLVIVCNALSAQIIVSFYDSTNTLQYNKLDEIDSLFIISTDSIYSLILSKLDSLDQASHFNEYIDSSYGGTVYAKFQIEHGKLIGSEIIRGVNAQLDSVFYSFSQVVFPIIQKHDEFPGNHFITIALKLDYRSKDEILIDEHSFTLKKRGYFILVNAYIEGYPIPTSIEDTELALDTSIRTSLIDLYKNDLLKYFIIGYQDVEQDILTHWISNEDSKLAEFFIEKGITDTEIMARIIIENYYYHINEMEFDVEARIKELIPDTGFGN